MTNKPHRYVQPGSSLDNFLRYAETEAIPAVRRRKSVVRISLAAATAWSLLIAPIVCIIAVANLFIGQAALFNTACFLVWSTAMVWTLANLIKYTFDRKDCRRCIAEASETIQETLGMLGDIDRVTRGMTEKEMDSLTAQTCRQACRVREELNEIDMRFEQFPVSRLVAKDFWGRIPRGCNWPCYIPVNITMALPRITKGIAPEVERLEQSLNDEASAMMAERVLPEGREIRARKREAAARARAECS